MAIFSLAFISIHYQAMTTEYTENPGTKKPLGLQKAFPVLHSTFKNKTQAKQHRISDVPNQQSQEFNMNI